MFKKVSVVVGGLVVCTSTLAQCTLPENLNDKVVLTKIVESYSGTNPMSDQLFKMHFQKKGEFTYKTLKDDAKFSGTYNYALVAKNIAVVTAAEKLNDAPVEYTMTMVCENQQSGYYVYQQTKGLNGARSNVARYYFVD